ncbi:putative enoyl-CoA hydratase/isomerase family protein [Chytriomyces sp. MP71]|nr:putative enoyl-CoA hydratase/isomerase family protein [Chytriomyces sp. MP71]
MSAANPEKAPVQVHRDGANVLVIRLNRAHRKNAVDRTTAALLHDAFVRFEDDASLCVAVLTGTHEVFCAGADLKEMVAGEHESDRVGKMNLLDSNFDKMGPMGPTRLALSKPVIAAIEGHAVAGGLELACWCDMRVAAQNATLGVFCRLRGVPLIDGGTVRLPKLIGLSRATDLILTGRSVLAAEAYTMGLVNLVAPQGKALSVAIQLAHSIAKHPRICMTQDRLSMRENAFADASAHPGKDADFSSVTSGDGRYNVYGAERAAMEREFKHGMQVVRSEEFGVAIRAFLTKEARL